MKYKEQSGFYSFQLRNGSEYLGLGESYESRAEAALAFSSEYEEAQKVVNDSFPEGALFEAYYVTGPDNAERQHVWASVNIVPTI